MDRTIPADSLPAPASPWSRIATFATRIDLAPRLVLGVTFVLICAPILFLFYGSFRSDAIGTPGAGFTTANWAEVYGGAGFRANFVSTLLLSSVVAVVSVAVGGALAWVVARTNAPGRRQISPFLVVPLMISTLVTALAWVALCAPNAGLLNSLMRSLFGIRTFFSIYSFDGMVLVLSLHFSSFAFIPLYAALQSIDGSLEEASFILGAGALRTAFKMTLGLIWPTVVSTGILVFVFVAENFAVPMLLGAQAGFHSLASSIYVDMSAEPARPTVAATSGILLLWIALLGTWWQRRIGRHARRYVTVGGKGSRPRVTDLGRWRYLATFALCLYLFLAVGLPYATLIVASLLHFVTPRLTWAMFTTDNYTAFMSWEYLQPVVNSITLAGGCALFGTLLYAYVAHLLRRSDGWASRVMDYVVALPTAMPALVLGVGLVWTYIWLPLPIYGTMGVLVIAYLTRFMGQGVRQSAVAMLQISGELPEAARIFGASPFRAFTDILVPALRPALVSLWTILFVLIFMEISMTILLYSPDTMTLPVLLWQSMAGGYQTQAFAVAVIQVSIVFVILLVAERLSGVLRKTVGQ